MPSTQDAKLYLGDTLICSPGSGEPWVRHDDWLALPEVGETEQKFVGLYAVTDDDSNILALSAEGAFTVDWGDGSSAENFASGVQAKHAYNYSAISSDTLSSRGYKQVVVTLTPQAENNLTQLKLQERPSEYGTQIRNHAWLDITVGSPLLTAFLLANTASPANYTRVIRTDWLEQVTIRSHAMTALDGMFQSCLALQSVPLFDTSSVTQIDNMFGYCITLQSVPLFDTSSVTSVYLMFGYCYSLQSVPLFDTSNVELMDQMFQDCHSLQSIPAFNCAGTNDTGAHAGQFQSCFSLASAPLSGTKYNISYANCKLSRSAIVDIFNGLATATRTITITGNRGIADLTSGDRAIATDKGWTIVE